MSDPKIFYLCDMAKDCCDSSTCGKNWGRGCFHTFDIKHSKSFIEVPAQDFTVSYWELMPDEWKVFDQESVYDNTFRDHYFYLLAVKGYGTPIKAKFHDDPFPCFTHYAMQNNVVGEYGIDLETITHWRYLPAMPEQEADNDRS